MKALICGLNSYLGRASLKLLDVHKWNMLGIARDIKLLRKKVDISAEIKLREIDINKDYQYTLLSDGSKFDFALYFTQPPNLNDTLQNNHELMSLHNFVKLAQENGCNRIVYVGRSYARKVLVKVEELFKELNVDYSIVVKDIAIGEGTSFDDFMHLLMQNNHIIFFKPKGDLSIRPFAMPDFFNWLQNIDWRVEYINTTIEFGGEKIMQLMDLVDLYLQKHKNFKGFKLTVLSHKFLVNWLNKLILNIDYNHYAEYISEVYTGKVVNNDKWKNNIPFQFTDINKAII